MGIQAVLVLRRDSSDHPPDELLLHSAYLAFDSTGHVQSSAAPVGEFEVRVRQLGCDRDNEQIARKAAQTNDDCRPNLIAIEIGKRNRQQNNITA